MSEAPARPFSERISLRAVMMPDDEDFLKELYFTTREDDIAMWGMPEPQTRSLVEIQYRAQKMQYDAQFPEARHDIILFDEKPVGRLLSTRNEREVLCIDVAVRPECRSKGIGTVILKGMMSEAGEAAIPFNLSVLKTNRKAIDLYQRLGFDFAGETVSHYLLQWLPEPANKKL
jgi:GNAT superfamily N-acetyltransferase